MKSLADFKRAIMIGRTFHCSNYNRPQSSGDRTVIDTTTNGFWYHRPDNPDDHYWLAYPKASKLIFQDETVTFLDGKNNPAFVFDFSEKEPSA